MALADGHGCLYVPTNKGHFMNSKNLNKVFHQINKALKDYMPRYYVKPTAMKVKCTCGSNLLFQTDHDSAYDLGCVMITCPKGCLDNLENNRNFETIYRSYSLSDNTENTKRAKKIEKKLFV